MEAAGFAAAIVAFVDFSIKIVKGSYELYQSQTGISDENLHIETVLKDLAEVTKGLGPASAATSGPTRGHRYALQQLALGCQNVAKELTEVLEDLKRKDGNKAWRSLEAKWKTMRKEPTIVSLEKRLDQYQSRIMIRLQSILEEKQDALQAQMEAMEHSDLRNAAATTHGLKEVSQAVQNLEARIAMQLEAEDQRNSMTELVTELQNVLQNLSLAPARTPAEVRILNRLYFKTMFARQNAISDASHGTFKWFLADEPPTLSDEYLDEIFGQVSEERRRDQPINAVRPVLPNVEQDIFNQVRVYEKFHHWLNTGGSLHISGKAGSGKSTLMRCLVEDPRLMTRLDQWAGSKKLVFASFFFSRLGDSEQKSLSGFYRSILFSVLEKCSDLIKDVFPTAYASPERPGSQWQDKAFSNTELRHALKNLVSDGANASRLGDLCFCFFVDGLDEYDGDSSEHFELAEQLKLWATSPAIRICVSSRPHIEFMDVFDEQSRIHLHQATNLDVLQLIHGNFRKANLLEHLMEGSLSETGTHDDVKTALNLLARELLTRANGVFLWVCLAIKTVLHGKRHRYSIKRLQENIRKFPAELDTLFEQMLLGIKSEDKQLSARLLLLATSRRLDKHRGGLTLLMVSFIDQLDDASFPFSSQIPERALSEIPETEVQERLQIGRCLLQSLTKGLFESPHCSLVVPTESNLSHYNRNMTVSALHSTVLEYTSDPTRSRNYNAIAGNFDVYDAFIRLRLAALMFYPRDQLEHQVGRFRAELGTFFDPGSDGSGQMTVAIFHQAETILCHKLGVLYELEKSDDQALEKVLFDRDSIIEGAIWTEGALQRSIPACRRHPLLYMAAYSGQVDFVISLVQADTALMSEDGSRMHLLCTAMKGNNVRLVEALLNSNVSPMDQMVVELEPGMGYLTVSVWAVFLRMLYYSGQLGWRRQPQHMVDANCHLLSLMLERKLNLDVIFIFEDSQRPSSHRLQTVALSLESILRLLNPPNLSKLLSQIRAIKKRDGGTNKNSSMAMGLEILRADSGAGKEWECLENISLREIRVGDQILPGTNFSFLVA